MRCMNCGTENQSGNRFCFHCGAPLAGADSGAYPPPTVGAEEFGETVPIGYNPVGPADDNETTPIIYNEPTPNGYNEPVPSGTGSYTPPPFDPTVSSPTVQLDDPNQPYRPEPIDDQGGGIESEKGGKKGGFKWPILVVTLLVIGAGFLGWRMLSEKISKDRLNDEIVNINILYDEVQDELDSGELKKVQDGDVYYHYDQNGDLRFVYVKPGADGLSYERTFYYYNDKPFFAYYEDDVSHSLYFKDDELIRWHYCEDKDVPADSVNYDQQHRDESYQDMESTVLAEAYSYLNH